MVKRCDEPSDETGWNKIGMIEDEDGDYVTYEDYARLEEALKFYAKNDTYREHVEPLEEGCLRITPIQEDCGEIARTALTGDRES